MPRLHWLYWLFLVIGFAPILGPYLVMAVWLTGDMLWPKSMVGLNLVNRTGQEVEVLELRIGAAPLSWQPVWGRPDGGWPAGSGTAMPRRVGDHASARTAALEPVPQAFRLALRPGPGLPEMSMAMMLAVPPRIFCVIDVELTPSRLDIGECRPVATMLGSAPVDD